METVAVPFRRLEGVSEDLEVTPPAASEIVDMAWDPRGFWRTAPGSLKINLASEGGGPGTIGAVLWLRWFRPFGRRERYLVFEEALTEATSRLVYLDMATRIPVVIQASRARTISPEFGIQTLEHRGWLYFFDGSNPAVRWKPEQDLASVGFDLVPAPEVQGGSDDNGITIVDVVGVTDFNGVSPVLEWPGQRGLGVAEDGALWEYGWATTVLNDLGMRSPLSPITYARGGTRDGTPGTDSYLRGAIVHMPQAPLSGMGQELWRTKQLVSDSAGVPQVYLHTVSHHAGRVDLIDFKPDRELLTLLDQEALGPFPRGVRAGTIWQERMFVVGQEPGVILYSHSRFLEQFPAANVLPLGVPEAGRVTSLHTTAQAVVVLCTNGIYLIKEQSGSYRIELMLKGKGSLAPRAVVEIPEIGLAFLDRTGPQVLAGALENQGSPTRVVPLGRPVSKTWERRINLDALHKARGLYIPHLREVWFHLPQSGSELQTFGIVYHLDIAQFSFRVGWPFGDFDVDQGVVWIGSNTDAVNGIYEVSFGHLDKAGVTFSSSYTSGWLVSSDRRQLRHVEVLPMGTSGTTMLVDVRQDREFVWTVGTESGRALLPTEREPARWGTGLWDTAVWEDYYRTRVPVQLIGERGYEHQVRISSAQMWLGGFELHFEPGRGAPDHPTRYPDR